MRKVLVICAMALFGSGLLSAAEVFAADDQAVSEEELEQRLSEARKRLDEAAREISEVTTQLHGDAMKHVVRMVHRDGGKSRAVIGINIGERNEDGKITGVSADGVVVLGVTPGGPADKAGLKTNDVLTSLNGKSLAGGGKASNDKLMAIMKDVEPGEKINIEYMRDGKKAKLDLETGEMSAPHFSGFVAPGADGDVFRWNHDMKAAMPPLPPMPMIAPAPARHWGGMELVPLTPKLGEYFNTDKGLLVVRAPESEGSELEEGDVILSIGDREPRDVRHAMRILRSYAAGETAEVEVMRKKRKRKIKVKVDAAMALGNAPGYEYRFFTPGDEGELELHIEEQVEGAGGDKEVVIRKRMKKPGARDDGAVVIVEKEAVGT